MDERQFSITGVVLVLWLSSSLASAQPADPPSTEGSAVVEVGVPDLPAASPEEPTKDEGSCKASQLAEEERVRRDLLPGYRAEGEAIALIRNWTDRSYKALKPMYQLVTKKELTDFWDQYDACVAKLQAPGEGPAPVCVAWVKKDPKQCELAYGEESRRGCAELVQTIRPVVDKIIEWREAGFAAESCTPEWVATTPLLTVPICRALVGSGTCDPEDLAKSLKGLCGMLKQGKAGKECSTPESRSSILCQLVDVASNANPNQACEAAVAAGTLGVPPGLCRLLQPMWKSCSQEALAPTVEALTMGCSMIQAWKNDVTTCDGLFEADSGGCGFFLSVSSRALGKPELCDQISIAPMQDECRVYPARTVDECPKISLEASQGLPFDDSTCRTMLWHKRVLPATEGRTEVRLTMSNHFIETATCKVDVAWNSEESSTNQSLSIQVPGDKVVYRQLYFLAPSKASFDVAVTCKWAGTMVTPVAPEEAKKQTPQ